MGGIEKIAEDLERVFEIKLTTSSLLFIYLETRYTAIRQSFLTVYIVLEWWDIDHQCLLCNFNMSFEFDVLREQRQQTPSTKKGLTVQVKS